MSWLLELHLIRFFGFYLAVMFLLSTWVRLRQYGTILRLVRSMPNRWPRLLQLVKQHAHIFLTWGSVLPLLLLLVIFTANYLASSWLWPQADEFTLAQLFSLPWVWPVVLVAGAAMAAFDTWGVVSVSVIDRAEMEQYFDQAEYWLVSWTAPVVRFFTLGRINPRLMVAVEVRGALVSSSQLLNSTLWWVVTQAGLRIAFGLSLWLSYALGPWLHPIVTPCPAPSEDVSSIKYDERPTTHLTETKPHVSHTSIPPPPKESVMLTCWGRKQRFCDNLHRREFLRLGALGLGGLTLADLLRLEARGETKEQGRAKSIIYIVLGGGPSHIDMYDLKPDAPAEYRGPFKPIATRLTGTRICELMPLQAAMMDRLTLLRGIRSVENDHFLSEVYTGLPRTAGHRPAFGSVVSRLADNRSALPSYVCLDRPATGPFEFERPYYAGAGHAPFRPFGDALDDLNPVKSVDRLQDRKQLLAAFDTMRRDLDHGDSLRGLDAFQAQALDIITAPKVRDAFDLSKEPDRLVDSYGTGKYPHQTVKTLFYPWDGKRFLLARRLVEAGVRVVTLRLGDWDHHGGPQADIFAALRCLLPLLDRSLYALTNDLRDRGLDKDVLVVVLGEFGRTPKIEPEGPGRGHWAEAGCALLSGGGLRMGQVVGETDARGERAKSGSINFQNILSTVYHVLGIDPATTLADFNGRPQYLLDDREPISALIG